MNSFASKDIDFVFKKFMSFFQIKITPEMEKGKVELPFMQNR